MAAPHLILVPGIGNPATVWDRCGKSLREQGYQVTQIELPGFGADRSAIWLRSADHAMACLLERIEGARIAGGNIVVAHSLGAMLVLGYGAELRIDGVVAVSATLREVLHRLAHLARWPDRFTLRVLALIAGSTLPLPPGGASAIAASGSLRSVLLGDLLFDPSAPRRSDLARVLSGTGSPSALAALTAGSFARRLQWWDDPPARFGLIAGERDAFMQPTDWELLDGLRKAAQMSITLPAAGHWLPVERPVELAGHIDRCCAAFER